MTPRQLRWKQTVKETAGIHTKEAADLVEPALTAQEATKPEADSTEALPLGSQEATEGVPNPAELTISQIKELNLSDTGWMALLQKEQDTGQPRKGVVDHVVSILGG